MFLSMVLFLHLFAAFYYWMEVILDLRIMNSGQVHFYVTFIVSISLFFNAFIRLAGMPRRIPDYPDEFEMI